MGKLTSYGETMQQAIYWKKKDLLDIESLSAKEITMILDTAENLEEISSRPVKKVPVLKGKTVVFFFMEPSTRTRISFEVAAKRLSADTLSITASSSSIVKGETLLDTAKNIETMRPDLLVIRHSAAGAPHFLATRLSSGVINAGDGMHSHPTQALLDMMVARRRLGGLKGRTISIIGDIAHSRVARSDIAGFVKLGARVMVFGPLTMIPPGIEKLGAEVATDIDSAIRHADAVILLRIQKERRGRDACLFPSLREYHMKYGLTQKRAGLLKPGAFVMHPGPINRGVEISPEVADGPASVILEQAGCGVAVRMAVFYLLAGGRRNENPD